MFARPISLKIKPIITFVSLILPVILIVGLFNTAAAKDKCENQDGTDDKIDCYQEKIDEKQEEYESTSKKLDEIRSKKDGVSSKISDLSSQLSVTQQELDSLDADIVSIEEALEEIAQNLSDRREKLSNKIALRNRVVRNYSKRTLLNDLELLFSFGSPVSLGAGLSGFQYTSLSHIFNKSISEEAVKLIMALNSEIGSFEKDQEEAENLKVELEDEKNNLVAIKADLDIKKVEAQSEFKELGDKESDYEGELADLQQEISELSQKQQSILSAKYGDGNGTVGDYESPDAKTPDPPFKPAFGAFSYGAYTHYKGMSQYGARGRAEDGKDYKKILEFYYKAGVEEKDNFPDDLCVEGYGEMDFQKYLYGLAEMPSDWPKDALKAQAIAGRSFAYRYEKQDRCICTSQSCQVFLKSKSDNPPSRWKEAVDDTKDKIVKDGVVTFYSSTTGGYIQNVGWDVDGSWPKDAYEKKGGSPWFYKAWYTKSYNNSDTCGHPHPWLTEEEMADILNAWVVWRKGSGDEKDHISPVTTSCWGGDPYSNSKMAEKADKYGEKYTSVSSVDVDISNGGYTSQVRLGTNRGTVSMDGDTFKTVFNLRAPAYIAIRSRLFDLEKRN